MPAGWRSLPLYSAPSSHDSSRSLFAMQHTSPVMESSLLGCSCHLWLWLALAFVAPRLVVLAPSVGSFQPRSTLCCPYLPGHRHAPVLAASLPPSPYNPAGRLGIFNCLQFLQQFSLASYALLCFSTCQHPHILVLISLCNPLIGAPGPAGICGVLDTSFLFD